MSAGHVLLFFVFLVGGVGGLNVQVFRWARNAWGLSRRAQRALQLMQVLAVAGMVLGRVAGRFWPGPVLGGVIAVSSTVELAVIISGVLLLAADALRLLLSLPARLHARRPVATRALDAPSGAPPSVAPGAPHVPSAAPAAELPRRAFLTQAAAGSAFLIGGSSSLYGALKGRYDYSIEEVVIKIPGLPRALDGFSIAQLSDVHIGVFVGDPELAIAEALLQKAKPDLIVLTGDLLDNDPSLAPQLGRFVRRLPRLAREGVVAISGNHDYFAGVEATAAAVRGAGALMLRNESLVIGGAGFALLGVDDVWARRAGQGPDLERAVLSLPRLNGRVAPARDLPRILLCHNPSYFAESAGQVALQLSGHTHGGQVNLGVRPADLLLPGGWVAGRYDQRGSVLYVNRGFGTVGPPARLGAPPEVTRIILTS